MNSVVFVILIQPVKFACTYWPSNLLEVCVLSSLLGRSEGGFQKQVLVLLSQVKKLFKYWEFKEGRFNVYLSCAV